MRIGEKREGAWILMDDFNEILNNEEKRGGVVRPESSFFPFREMMRFDRRRKRQKGFNEVGKLCRRIWKEIWS